jgi:hypothetical protein
MTGPPPTSGSTCPRCGRCCARASYRAALERQGRAGIEETVIAGDERAVERAVRAYSDAGATELVASLTGDDADRARTRDFLAGLRGIRS